MKIRLLGAQAEYEVLEVGVLRPAHEPGTRLRAGESGYVVANIKALHDVRIGDTVVERRSARRASRRCRATASPSRWSTAGSTRPTRRTTRRCARRSTRCALNDASFTYLPETSEALGFGFRCGFLGLLHMEIVQERLERDADLDLVQTAPNVTYEILPHRQDRQARREAVRHPRVELHRGVPRADRALLDDPAGRVHRRDDADLHREARRVRQDRVPLADARDARLRRPARRDRLRLLRQAEVGDARLRHARLRGHGLRRRATSCACASSSTATRSTRSRWSCHRDAAERRGRVLLKRLRKAIPRHLFAVPLQAAIGGKIIARETIAPLRKDVLAKCYGGDITRKRKLLEKQKKGKKRMKLVGQRRDPAGGLPVGALERRGRRGRRLSAPARSRRRRVSAPPATARACRRGCRASASNPATRVAAPGAPKSFELGARVGAADGRRVAVVGPGDRPVRAAAVPAGPAPPRRAAVLAARRRSAAATRDTRALGARLVPRQPRGVRVRDPARAAAAALLHRGLQDPDEVDGADAVRRELRRAPEDGRRPHRRRQDGLPLPRTRAVGRRRSSASRSTGRATSSSASPACRASSCASNGATSGSRGLPRPAATPSTASRASPSACGTSSTRPSIPRSAATPSACPASWWRDDTVGGAGWSPITSLREFAYPGDPEPGPAGAARAAVLRYGYTILDTSRADSDPALHLRRARDARRPRAGHARDDRSVGMDPRVAPRRRTHAPARARVARPGRVGRLDARRAARAARAARTGGGRRSSSRASTATCASRSTARNGPSCATRPRSPPREPIEATRDGSEPQALSMSVRGAPLVVRDVRVDHDLYYTNHRSDGRMVGRSPATRGVIPDDAYFMLGDNTKQSNDSRLWGASGRPPQERTSEIWYDPSPSADEDEPHYPALPDRRRRLGRGAARRRGRRAPLERRRPEARRGHALDAHAVRHARAHRRQGLVRDVRRASTSGRSKVPKVETRGRVRFIH